VKSNLGVASWPPVNGKAHRNVLRRKMNKRLCARSTASTLHVKRSDSPLPWYAAFSGLDHLRFCFLALFFRLLPPVRTCLFSHKPPTQSIALNKMCCDYTKA
jgi:hypothetical protein